MTNPADYPYDTQLDIKYGPLEKFSLSEIAKGITHPWHNQTLVKVNESVLRLGILKGVYHWHHHDVEDEVFFVVEGTFLIDLEPQADGITPGKVIELNAGEGYMIPHGIEHRTRAPERCIVLMIEPAAIVPTGAKGVL